MNHQRPWLHTAVCCLFLFAFLLFTFAFAAAQSTTATLGGEVIDPNGAVVPGVVIKIFNPATAFTRETTTNDAGAYTFPLLPPGTYSITAQRDGFFTAQIPNIVLNVGDQRSLKIELKVGDVKETVVVTGEAPLVNTSGAVGTVVDRQFVENIPLNGRSFQSLLELTPGVILTRVGSYDAGNLGQFSVNGQRPNANYWTVDGVSANVGINGGLSPFPGQSGSGQLPALTALGSTNSLVSVDALQEFRIQTSTYAAEFGRMPGGQVSLVTRSGTNQFHGSVFDYFRDDALDASDWFVNANRLPRPQLRQHQFGGTFSGPVMLPQFGQGDKAYWSGWNKTFFFFSYEGLRLLEPRAQVVSVPTLAVRQTAVPAVRPLVNALPLPNGRDLGGGFAEFAASYSDPSRFDATAVRIDHHAGEKLTFFGRFSHTPSYSRVRTRGISFTNTTNQNNTSFTAGSTWIVSNRVVHDLRVNYSTNEAPFVAQPDDFGGAVPPPASIFGPGRNPDNTMFLFQLGTSWQWGTGTAFKQRQLNIVDSVTWSTGSHEWKFGLDFRRIHPLLSGSSGLENPGFENLGFNIAGLSLGTARFYQATFRAPGRRAVAFDNFSLYAQDNWKLTPRLTLTYGLRWEFIPPPHATEGENAITLENLDDPLGGQVHLAPRDTPLWKTRYNSFAPRVGTSYVVSEKAGAQLVVRGGFGIFHDLGYGQIASAFASSYPFIASKLVIGPSFPLTADVQAPPVFGVDPPGGLGLFVLDRSIVLPRTYQWNVSVERSFGPRQTLTGSYVGAAGRKLLKLDSYKISLLEWPTVRTMVNVNRNRGYSDYRALQVQFQRRLDRGLQSLVSYTFGRSRDTSSSDGATQIPGELLRPEADYGYSDYDVRHLLTAAVTYQVPELAGSSLWRLAARGWGIDMMLRARSGFPVNVSAFEPFFPPDSFFVRPNVVPGQPFWIEDPAAPGGRRLNRQAFTAPAAGKQGGLTRGAVRGFRARQVDLALRRDFGLREPLRLQLRFEMFNLFNTPNFNDPNGNLASGTFGSATQMLNRGFGGLSSLYQIGGPRSVQIAAKLLF